MSTPIDPNVYQPRHTTLTKITAVPLTANKAGFRLALNADGTDFVWVAPDTNQVPEGGNNLYFTTARARAAINGAASTVLTANLPLSRVLVSNSTGKIVSSAITAVELGYLGGVTKPLQTQLTALTTSINDLVAFPRTLATITGAVSAITTINLPASKVLVSDASGKVIAGNVTSAEVDHLSGVTANVQAQLSVLGNRIGTLDTTGVVEGTNQYFTPARAVAAITGGASTIVSTNLTPSKALASNAEGKIVPSVVTTTELAYLAGVTSPIQTQINNISTTVGASTTTSITEGTNLYFTSARAVAAITGAASTISSANLTASKVLASDSNGKVVTSTITSTELAYLTGVTSPIQAQISAIAAQSGNTSTLTTTSITEGTNLYFTGARVLSTITGAASTIATTNLTASRVLSSDATGKVVATTVTSTELGYLAGTTSNLQTQVTGLSTTISGLTTTSVVEGTNQYFTPAKAVASITGAASTIATTNLSTSRALTSDGTGKVSASAVTTTELAYLAGTTSAIQTQINTLTGRTVTVGSGMTGGGNLSSNISIGLSFDASTSNIKMDGIVSLGTLSTVSRADHVHPSDTSKVNVSLLGVANGIATLDSASKVPVSQIPALTTQMGFGGETITVPYTGSGLTIPVLISQGGTGATTAASALASLGAQTYYPVLTSLHTAAGVGLVVKNADGLINIRTLQVNSPITITNSTGGTTNPTISLLQGAGSGLDADLLDGLQGSSYLRTDGVITYTGTPANTIRTSILAASSGSNTDITNLSAITGLGNGSNTHLRIASSGEVLVGVPSPAANGGDINISRGLTFPSTQVPCSNLNTLDDYKEGTWIPAIDSVNAGTGRITSVGYAAFTKIGNMVTFTANISLSTLGTGGSSYTVIRGLPYTPLSMGGLAQWAVCVPFFLNLKNPITYLAGTIQPGSTDIVLRGANANANGVSVIDFAGYMQASTALIFSGFYYV